MRIRTFVAVVLGWLLLGAASATGADPVVAGPAKGPASQGPASQGPASRAGIDLLPRDAQVGRLPLSDFTFELWIRPDAACAARPRTLVWFLTNRGGNDAAGFGVSMAKGRLHVNALGVGLDAATPLPANRWSHVAVTFDAQTINPQCTLWVDGKRIDQKLVTQPWPASFDRFQVFGDPWVSRTRDFTGSWGGVRFSRAVRYRKPFHPPVKWTRDATTRLLLTPADKPD